jgi:photosystem II stability/assembly factor-like uncharacterized protein
MEHRRFFLPLSLALLVVAAGSADANGRFPRTASIGFRHGSDQHLILGTTFGLLLSEDDGKSWRWTCEKNIGYGGTYDPVYAATSAGTLLATTFEGLSISTDGGCTWAFAEDPLTGHWVSDVLVAPDGAIWATTSSGGRDNDVYVSRDDGKTFASTKLHTDRAWWRSIRVAPTDEKRVYVSGYQLADPTIDAGASTTPLLFRSDDAGETWTPIALSSDVTVPIFLLGVSPTHPDLVFARTDDDPTDRLLRSQDGARTFEEVATFQADILAFASLQGGKTFLVGTLNQGVRISHDEGKTWQTPKEQPRMACAGDRPQDGEIFACGSNFRPDLFALGRSGDGETWSETVRFVEIGGELSCGEGSGHARFCSELWPTVMTQFGIGLPDAGPRVPPDASITPKTPSGCGCGISLSLIFVVLMPISRRSSSSRRGR